MTNRTPNPKPSSSKMVNALQKFNSALARSMQNESKYSTSCDSETPAVPVTVTSFGVTYTNAPRVTRGDNVLLAETVR